MARSCADICPWPSAAGGAALAERMLKMQAFWNWFIGEAGAAWIIGLLGLLAMLYSWQHRERAPRVIVQEVKKTRLLNIHPSQRETLTVIHTDSNGNQTRIQDLEQREIVIYNNGTRDILEPLQLVLRFHEAGSREERFHGFWRLVFDDGTCAWKQIDGDIQIELPYLNSYLVHRHYIKGYLISDKEIEIRVLDGIGRGWSARFIALHWVEDLEQRISNIIAKISKISLGLGFGMIVLALALSFQDPFGQILFNPTPESTEVAVSKFRHLLEIIRTSGIIGYWRALLSGLFGLSGIFSFFGFTILGLTIVLMPLIEWIGIIALHQCIGARSLSEFD